MTASLLVLLAALSQAGPDTVVVCPDAFRPALTPWVEFRTGQGHRIELVSGNQRAKAVRDRIREVAEAGSLRFVMLVGDAEPAMRFDPAIRARCVPTYWAKADVIQLWNSPPHIGTDSWYADLDDDLVPDVAIGRLTADSPGELTRIVQKILDYERSEDFGPWRRRLNFVAGVGGFSRLADTVLESTAKGLLTEGIPPDCRLSMTYGSWQSSYCPDPTAFHETTLRRLNEGCWFWVYLGHGYHLGLDAIHVPDGDYPILDMDDVAGLDCRHGAPIAVFLACYTGAFDAWEDCLAEEMLRTPGAPVAVLAGSRVTMPYAMTVMGTGLMEAVFEKRAATLGEAILEAKRGLVQSSSEAGAQRAVLDLMALAISPAPGKLDVERAEHVQLFNLIGDPLLRLRHPQQIALDVASTAEPGQAIRVAGSCPIDGEATVELVLPRGRSSGSPPRNDYPESREQLAQFQEVYRRMNDGRLADAVVPVTGGRFETELKIPADAHGPCTIRVYVQSPTDFAQAATQLTIGPSETVARRVEVVEQNAEGEGFEAP